MYSLAGRYVKQGCRTGPLGWESMPGLIKRCTNTASVSYKDTKLLYLKYKCRVHAEFYCIYIVQLVMYYRVFADMYKNSDKMPFMKRTATICLLAHKSRWLQITYLYQIVHHVEKLNCVRFFSLLKILQIGWQFRTVYCITFQQVTFPGVWGERPHRVPVQKCLAFPGILFLNP